MIPCERDHAKSATSRGSRDDGRTIAAAARPRCMLHARFSLHAACRQKRVGTNSLSEEELSMGLIDFVKDAGEKLFGRGQAQAATKDAAADPGDANKVQAANSAAADAILDYVKSQNLSATGLTVTYDGATSTVSVFGVAPDQATREKIVLCCGNVAGVVAVKDMMSVDKSEPEAKYYTVVSGDTLSKISKQFYGDPNKYNQIFEANKPMLKSPDKIYPGQNLRIPPA
jgi:nucleoid-associated protein YgaU